MKSVTWQWCSLFCLLVLPTYLGAAVPGLDAITLTTDDSGVQRYSLTLQVLALMTVLSLLPTFLIMMTAFTRIIIVLAMLRQALGTQQTPSNRILVGLGLFLTLFVMMPVFERTYQDAVTPYLEEKIGPQEALKKAEVPFREFMMAQTRIEDLGLFYRLSGREDLVEPENVPFTVLVPAFLTSELKTGFQIGFLIFIPFLIIDLVVASILMAMGMMMLSPLIISLPFKIMLFVLVDGWVLVIGTLASSFGTL